MTFEHRRDAVHEGILCGEIGCPFAAIAARNDEIQYCRSPREISPRTMNEAYVEAITAFALDRMKSVLIALPDSADVRNETEATAYAHALFPETVSSMNAATISALDKLLEVEEGNEDLYEVLFSSQLSREEVFGFWEKNSEVLTDSPFGGLATQRLLRSKSLEVEPVFSFTVDPSYQPIRGKVHPRHSPHFALVMNWHNDLQNLMERHPDILNATKRWEIDTVGYEYVQGYRIKQIPAPMNKTRELWKPRD